MWPKRKGLELNIKLADNLPHNIITDPQRVKQIIKNLLSNAFKFTQAGSVCLNIYQPAKEVDLGQGDLSPSQVVAISVADTGIGLSSEQQKIIFEAFQQADGGTSRQYGGTGLGLSISRELANRLGGQIMVESELQKGSTFTLYLPFTFEEASPPANDSRISSKHKKNQRNGTAPVEQSPVFDLRGQKTENQATTISTSDNALPDDRDNLEVGDKLLLIIEDDPKFAKTVYNFAQQKDFKCLITDKGEMGLQLAKQYTPEAIILDLHLPDISGWQVLDRLKNDPVTRHIPVHIMSADKAVLDAYKKGAVGFLTKPVSLEALHTSFQKIEHVIAKEIKSLLLVEDDAHARHSIRKLLDGRDVQISEAERGQMALELLQTASFDCVILDLSLPDMSGFEVLKNMNGQAAEARCPVIVYTARDLTPEEDAELLQYTDSIIVKGVKSPERLLDETALFLHRIVDEMPQDKQQTIKRLYNEDDLFKDKNILIVDDDMRNSFALSKLLSEKGSKVKMAANGQKGLELLDQEPVDLVLMDIMMPVMDGYEAMQHIRALPNLKDLPILALTAKAMKGDREKCLAAGANDYLTKPIDIDRLFSMLRVWLYQ